MNENIDLNKFRNNSGLTYNQIIKDFFLQYLKTIENFENNNSLKQIKFDQNRYNEIKEEVKLEIETIHFIDTYYFNIPSDILFEFLKLFPELIYFKSTNFNIENYINNLRSIKNPGFIQRNKFNNICETIINLFFKILNQILKNI